MKLIFGIILSIPFYLCFGLWLALFHPIQVICHKFFGYRAHKKSVDVLNWFLTYNSVLLFNFPVFKNTFNLPTNRPIIFVSNHQSAYDIPGLIYFLRKHHGKFISKIELAKAKIPSIAFNLLHGGGANIDRKDSVQSKAEIAKLAERMKANNWSAFIFPEGTRTKTGFMKEFHVGGIAAMHAIIPDVLIVPVAVNGSYEMTKKGMFPLMAFTPLTWEVLQPIETAGRDIAEVIKEAEVAIRGKVK